MTAPEERAESLEQALARLDGIAERLETGEIELAEALALYEEGVRLVRIADGVLSAAEDRIHQLRPDGAGFRVEPMEESE